LAVGTGHLVREAAPGRDATAQVIGEL
jgi:hypothetical protein